jgi:ArsR family transcriptional regulator
MNTERQEMAALFKILMHPVRLAILEILRAEEECVCHMEATLGLRQAYISQQLSVLRQSGLVDIRRDGWNAYYQVARPEIYAVIDAARVMLPQNNQRRLAAFLATPKGGTCACPKCQARVAA